MMEKIKTISVSKWIILLILLVAAFLRLWKLGSNPPHLSPDEAALGYNAYSILKTGKDEYGKLLPVIFKSFGDYKPGLYIYLTVPFVALFGLNEYAVRLPSAISGIIAVWILYLIIKEFSENNNLKINLPEKTKNYKIEYFAAALLALSPWHIHFSRGAWEVNLSLTLTLAGILFFLKALKDFRYIYPSVIFFALTLVTYQGAKLSTIIVVVTLFAVFIKEIYQKIKENLFKFLISLTLGIIISFPIIMSLFRGQTGRLTVFSIFSYPRPADYLQNFLDQGNEKVGSLSYYLFHSETLNFFRGFAGRYFNHIGGRFLFFEGDYQNPKHSSPNSGMMLLADIVLVIFGIVSLIKMKNKLSKFTFSWLSLAPLPAALTRDQVQAVRSYNMVIPLIILASFGLIFILNNIGRLKSIYSRALGYSLLLISYLFSLIYFFDSYFVHLPIHDAKYWNWGYKQAVEVITPIQGNYEKVLFQQSYDQPYIYFLFYQKYDPSVYQKHASLVENKYGDVGLVEQLDNIYFLGWSWPYATGEKNTLIVGSDVAIPSDWSRKDYSEIAVIKYPDNFMTAFRILETK